MNINELPLQVRFEAAYGEFRPVYRRKVRAALSGEQPYPSHELHRDVYAAAGNAEDCLIEAALRNGMDYLVRDPRPGSQQEILRLPEEEGGE